MSRRDDGLVSSNRVFSVGQIVYDAKHTDPTDAPLMVTNPDAGLIRDLDAKTYRLVTENDANKEIGFSDSTTAVKAVYVSEEVGDKEYTFPATRCVVPNPSGSSETALPAELVQADLLARMLRVAAHTDSNYSVEEVQTLAMNAGVREWVLKTATDWRASSAAPITDVSSDD